jgi:uncharacterized membrane protein HdeD (DUF308 family)
MSFSMQNTDLNFSEIRKNWGWILTWGIALIILGILAISTAAFTTYLSVLFIGALFFIGGVFVLITDFQYWWGKWRGFIGHLIVAILYMILGLMLLLGPIPGALSLTMVLAIAFIVIGLYKIIFSLWARLPNWGWSLFSGIVTFILGIMIIYQMPISGLYILGLFVGIDLFFWGWTYVMIALLARRRNRAIAQSQ